MTSLELRNLMSVKTLAYYLTIVAKIGSSWILVDWQILEVRKSFEGSTTATTMFIHLICCMLGILQKENCIIRLVLVA